MSEMIGRWCVVNSSEIPMFRGNGDIQCKVVSEPYGGKDGAYVVVRPYTYSECSDYVPVNITALVFDRPTLDYEIDLINAHLKKREVVEEVVTPDWKFYVYGDSNQLSDCVLKLRSLGFKFKDFGAGYQSLRLWRYLRVEDGVIHSESNEPEGYTYWTPAQVEWEVDQLKPEPKLFADEYLTDVPLSGIRVTYV